MQDHLDMHFRQNRKASQNTGRGHSRSWFIGVDVRVRFLYDTLTATHNAFQDWIHDVSVDVKGKGRTDGNRPLNAKAAAAAVIAKRDAELRALYVVVPPGDEAKPVSCPICKEAIKSEFLEDDEDWVWKNATKKDDRVCFRSLRLFLWLLIFSQQIYHATCHAEAVASTNNLLAARLRNELASGSRGGTPEVHSSRSTPPKHGIRSPSPQSKPVGTKRKVENEDASLNTEADGSPPMKKLALES
jgi:pre-mRNA cleavage complex 2 protein Pcf11